MITFNISIILKLVLQKTNCVDFTAGSFILKKTLVKYSIQIFLGATVIKCVSCKKILDNRLAGRSRSFLSLRKASEFACSPHLFVGVLYVLWFSPIVKNIGSLETLNRLVGSQRGALCHLPAWINR